MFLCHISILVCFSKSLFFPFLSNQLLDSLIPCPFIRYPPPCNDVVLWHFVIQPIDFIGNVHRINFWVLFGCIGRRHVWFGNTRRAGGRLCGGNSCERAEGCQEFLLNDIILIYVRFGRIAFLGYVVVHIAGLATELIVTGNWTVPRENFHATKHWLVSLTMIFWKRKREQINKEHLHVNQKKKHSWGFGSGLRIWYFNVGWETGNWAFYQQKQT